MVSPVSEHLAYLCKLTHRTLRIPVFYLDAAKRIVCEYAPGFRPNPFRESKEEMLGPLWEEVEESRLPLIQRTRYGEVFATVPIRIDGIDCGAIFVGPSIGSDPSETELQELLREAGIAGERQEAFARYYESLPCVPLADGVLACAQLHYMLYRDPIDPMEIYRQSPSLHADPGDIELAELHLANSRENTSFHHDVGFEYRTLQAVREGDEERTLQVWRELPKHGRLGLLSKTSLLRSRKNIAITVITLAARAAVEGGLEYETALTVSDLYIQAAEERRDRESVDLLIEEALADYARRVHATKRRRYSKPVNACLDYIFKHLYEEIALAELARQAAVHPNYLSSLFHREVGRSIRDYVRDARIEEAATLLRLTDRSISEVSTMLNFHDQSYFTKTFKKVMGVTPKKFRSGAGRMETRTEDSE